MSVRDVIAKFEKEREEIRQKIADLEERASTVDLMVRELHAAAKGGGRKRPSKPATAKAAGKATKKPVKKKAPEAAPRKKKGITVRAAILQAVAAASAPVTAAEIIEKAVALSGGAVPSIRTQINSLTRDGELEQLPYKGRGFQYKIGSAK